MSSKYDISQLSPEQLEILINNAVAAKAKQKASNKRWREENKEKVAKYHKDRQEKIKFLVNLGKERSLVK